MTRPKDIAAVFQCQIDAIVQDDLLKRRLLPGKQKRGEADVGMVSHAHGRTMFAVLGGNRRQIVEHDIRRAISRLCNEALGWSRNSDDPRIKVRRELGISSLGQADNPGSSRKGMRWTRHERPDRAVVRT